ncbi:MAG: stage II sporulation protein R, partial [Dorea sp.]
MKRILNNDRLKQVVCVILGICAAWLLTSTVLERREIVAEAHMADTQKNLAKEVLRFHVLANSDSEEDQELKLKVRDAVLSYMKENVNEDLSRGETEEWVQAHLDQIVKCAEEAISAEGYSYPVAAKISNSYFPDKCYGDVCFPKGYYEALRVVIGEGGGHNWWCVLYPTLCFTEATCAVVSEDGKEKLQNVLSEDEYEMVTATS